MGAQGLFYMCFEVSTSRGHKDIIDQSCEAVIFSNTAHRDLSASNLPGLIQWIDDPVVPEILAILKSPTSRFEKMIQNRDPNR